MKEKHSQADDGYLMLLKCSPSEINKNMYCRRRNLSDSWSPEPPRQKISSSSGKAHNGNFRR